MAAGAARVRRGGEPARKPFAGRSHMVDDFIREKRATAIRVAAGLADAPLSAVSLAKVIGIHHRPEHGGLRTRRSA